jgi:hypothetical protein
MKRHRKAMESVNCEAFLQLFIDAFHWVTRADEAMREAVYEDIASYDSEAEQIVVDLFQAWLKPCDYAEQWIQFELTQGNSFDNHEEFRQCTAEVRAIVTANESNHMPEAMIRLQEKAATEQRNGKTTEFI